MLKLVRLTMGLFVPLAVLVASLLCLTRASASSQSPNWTDTGYTIAKEGDVSSLPSTINGNISCDSISPSSCVVPTGYGVASTQSTVQLNGTQQFYPVYSYVDNHAHFIPIPHSNAFITYTTEPAYGLYLNFNYSFSGSVTFKYLGSDSYYQAVRPPDGRLQNLAGQRLAADYNSIAFSENGRWMIVSEPNVALLRVNLDNFQVTRFASGFNYSNGLDPALRSTISNDGRYVALASKTYGTFGVYDLDSCDAETHCAYSDLINATRGQIPGYISSSNMHFVDDYNLQFYAARGDLVRPSISRYIVTAAGGELNRIESLAVGDSFISGEGEFDYKPGTDTGLNKCHLSYLSYPVLLGLDLGFDSYNSVACSGARTNDLIDTNENYTGQAIPHLSRKEINKDNETPEYLANFQPGYIDQLDFVSAYQPGTIIMSIGGNDMGFSSILDECVEPWKPNSCYTTYEDRLELVRMIETQVFPKLLQTYQTVKSAAPPNAKIYVVGYPQVAKPLGNCALNVHLNESDIEMSQELIHYLDQVISTASSRAGVFYVDNEDSLVGHRLCEAKPGSVAVNGLTAGHDQGGILSAPIGNESFHPNDFGHELLENSVLSHTAKLTAEMPDPNLNASLPAESSIDLLNSAHSGRNIHTTEYDPDVAPDVISKQSVNTFSINGSDHSLGSSTALNLELHSDVVNLGLFTTDSDGNISGSFMIPDYVPTGYHTLHFYGQDLIGQPIDIYKYVYVAGSSSDVDGDGIADISEKCVGIPASGVDYDQDGIDDSCDGNISKAPVAAVPAAAEVLPNQQIISPPTTYTTPQVLAAHTYSATPTGNNFAKLTPISEQSKDSVKIIIIAASACIWIALSYAAWEFR